MLTTIRSLLVRILSICTNHSVRKAGTWRMASTGLCAGHRPKATRRWMVWKYPCRYLSLLSPPFLPHYTPYTLSRLRSEAQGRKQAMSAGHCLCPLWADCATGEHHLLYPLDIQTLPYSFKPMRRPFHFRSDSVWARQQWMVNAQHLIACPEEVEKDLFETRLNTPIYWNPLIKHEPLSSRAHSTFDFF